MITLILGAGLIVALMTLVTLIVVLVTQLPQRVAALAAVEIIKRLDRGLLAEWWAARLAEAPRVVDSHPAPIISGVVTERPPSPLRVAPVARDEAAPRSDPPTTYGALLHDKPDPGPGMVAAGLGPRPRGPRQAVGSDPTLPSARGADDAAEST